MLKLCIISILPTAFYFTKTSPAISNSQAHSTIRKGSDAVGYHSITVYPGWNVISVNLENITDKENGYTMDQIFPGKTPGLVANRKQTLADYIQIWDNEAGGYSTTYYYLWVSKNGDQPADDYTWREDADIIMPSDVLKMGCGVWYFHRGDTPITLKLTPPYSL